MEPIIILVLVGALGGIARGFLGYQVQSDEGEQFAWMKIIKSMIRASVAGALIVYNTVDMTAITGVQPYIGAFFTSMGADVLLKEIYGSVAPAIKGAR